MEIVSRVHAKNLVGWAKDKPEVVVLGRFDGFHRDRYV